MSRKLLFIYNPLSGTSAIKPVLSDLLDLFVKQGFDVTVRPTQARGDACEIVEARGREFDRIICAGGDGTLDEVATGLLKQGLQTEIGYIPCGSTNDYAGSVGIPSDLVGAGKIACGKNLSALDMGSLNEDYFIYVAAFGLFTDVSYQTPQELKNILGHTAYVLHALKTLKDIPSSSYMLQVEYDGNTIYDAFIYGMVTNSNSVGGIQGIISGDISLSDGLFEVTLIRTPENPLELSEIIAALTGVSPESDLVLTFQTKELRIISASEIPYTVDGEFGGKHKVARIKNIPRALRIAIA